MSKQAKLFTNGRVLTSAGLTEGLVVLVENGRIKSINNESEVSTQAALVHDLKGDLLLPGFIDTQVNGGGGVLFNDEPTIEGIKAISEAHQQFGTTGFLPTLISDDLNIVDKAMRATEAAIEQGVAGVLGIHIEGPFLNPERRGVHDESKLKKLTDETLSSLTALSNGKTMITIAPEMVSPNSIQALINKGFVVSLGHTNASYNETVTALQHGASGFTHLFNAMSQLGPRESGVVGAALDDQDSWCGIIADGHHISPASLRIALRCKSRDKIMLVTDAMPPVGTDHTRFKLLDKMIDVSEGICRDQNGTLAGTALTMSDAISNTIKMSDLSLPIAVEMASKNPASFLGLTKEVGSITIGKRADLVVVDSSINVKMTFKYGKKVYDASTRASNTSGYNISSGGA